MDKLTSQQAVAVENRGGKLLVSAAAGSGKTKVLVDRLLKYLTDPNDPADLDDFLIITYTKAAASELRGKIAAKLSQRIAQEPENKHLQKQMQRLFLTKISTVHGFCGDILREYAYRLELPGDFRVADENECREIRELVLRDLLDNAYSREDPSFLAFVDTQGLGRTDKLVPELIEKVYDSARCHLNPDGWLDSCLAGFGEDCTDAARTPWGKYLVGNLREFLAAQIQIFENFAQAADNTPGFEKVTSNLRSTLYQLQALRDAETWDAVVSLGSVDYGRLTFPKKQGDPDLEARIKAARNACKKDLDKLLSAFCDSSDRVLSDLRATQEAARGLVALVREFGQAYTRAKRSRRCVDFGDLEHKTLDLLWGSKRSSVTAAAGEIGARFREILVDEYQDSNAVQDAIFAALTAKNHNCFMVGDVKQSIYQFRLADPGIFLEKYHSYVDAQEAAQGQGRKINLSHNFRSGPEIIQAVNHVFATCMSPQVGDLAYTDAEALREGIPHEKLPGNAVELHGIEVREDTYEEEAAFVAQRIRKMLDDGEPVRDREGLRPVTPDDIVILLRSPGSVGGHFQRALNRLGIRCASGGGDDLLKTQEMESLRALLQVIANPRVDIPLIAALSSPIFGFTADDLAVIRGENQSCGFYEALLDSNLPKAQHFLEVLDQLRRYGRMCRLTELLERCFTLTRLDSIYSAMDHGRQRWENLQVFYQLASDFESAAPKTLQQFLEHLDALEEKGLIQSGSTQEKAVTIMSIHKSKGLEFPVVFLAGLSRSFNREGLRAQILCHKDLGLGLSVADRKNRVRYPSQAKRAIGAKITAESLSEEMRVLYVAMTRARDRLVMTYAVKNLEADLTDIVLRKDLPGHLLCSGVSCPGEWILQAALGCTEAGEFFALAGKPAQTKLSDSPWKITVTQAPQRQEGAAESGEVLESMPVDARQRLHQALTFRYGHTAATQTPSKQTATARKGRVKDNEAAEKAKEIKPEFRAWRKPGFAEDGMAGKEYGSAIHSAMQYIRYEACADETAVRGELDRLVSEGYLTRQQADAADSAMIARFFETDIGQKLRCGARHIREFKFSILDDAAHYGDGLRGEQVLLQGVVDCALVEEDGITVIDFKTDRVTPETLPQAVERYRLQVQTYCEALERIYQKKVKGGLLYFFRLNTYVNV